MAKKADYEETKQDMTSMIDVVFLLIIFFILMPPKHMEKQLQAYLPQDGSPPVPSNAPPPPPEAKFTITLSAQPQGNEEVSTTISFNNRPVCSVISLSISALDQIYAMGVSDKRNRLEKESKRDEKTLDPTRSADLHLLIQRMGEAALGAQKGKETKIIIDSDYNVPFKVVLAVINAGAGAEFTNISFASPSQDIWKQSP